MNLKTSSSWTDLTGLTLREAAQGLAAGHWTAEQLAEALLQRVDETASLGGLLHHDRPGLMAQARAADALPREQVVRRPLHGVPLVFKDNIDIAGLPTTAGSRALIGHIPQRHAIVTQRLLDAGALVLGKANMHEFAYGVTNNNPAFGPACNPWDQTRIPGGSSGGTAVVVAARAAPAGIGTDTGGSIRIPAAHCGLVGFRPSTGRWPADGIVPISATLDTPGPMARSVADCVLLDGVVTAGALQLDSAPLKGLRLGLPREHFWEPLDPAVAKILDAVLARLVDAGVVLVPCAIDNVASLSAEATLPISLYETLPGLSRYHLQHGRPFDARSITAHIESPDVRAVFEELLAPRAVTEKAYRHALDVQRPQLQAAYRHCFASHQLDALLFPTTPLPAALVGEDKVVRLNGQDLPTFPTYIRNTSPGALAGLPGISLPAGLTPEGLPVGLELDAAAGQDARLLSIALAFEALLPALPPPPTHH